MSDPKLRILVVEDQVDTAFGLKMYFSEKGHDVRVALNVKSALAAADEGPFDIVLCDLALPELPSPDTHLRWRPYSPLCRKNPVAGALLDTP